MLCTTEVRYVYQLDGIFYFNRRVSKELMHHYDKSKIVFSLTTVKIMDRLLENPIFPDPLLLPPSLAPDSCSYL